MRCISFKNLFIVILHLFMPLYSAAENIEDIKFTSAPDSHCYSPNEILIQFKNNFMFDYQTWKNFKESGDVKLDSLNSVFHVAQVFPLSSEKSYSIINKNQTNLDNIFLFRFYEKKSIRKLLKHYKALKIVRLAEANYYYSYGFRQKLAVSSLDKIQMKRAAEFIRFEKTVVIAILGSGIDWQRKELLPNLWRNPLEKADGKDNDGNGFIDDIKGADFTILNSPLISEESLLQDTDGFSTDLCAEIDHIVNHPFGVKDVGINKFMILKAAELNAEKKLIFDTFSLARALTYAADNNADIINISAYGEYPSKILKYAIDYAKNNNCTIIAAAGGKNSTTPVYPAAFENVISVAATDFNDKKTETSNYGQWVDITAPGYLNYQISDTGNAFLTESAIAAAQVTGLAGLLLTNEEKINSDSLKKRIFFSSENIHDENPDFHGMLGAGRINIYRALKNKQQPNIIIQKIEFQSAEQNNSISQGDTVFVLIKLQNLSFKAKNITIQLFSSNQNVHFIRSEDFIPSINFQAEYENNKNPLKLIVDKRNLLEKIPEITLQIKTDNNFSFTNTYKMQPGSADIKSLPSQIEFSFSPAADTTISCGDSLKLLIEPFSETLLFRWFKNENIDSTNSNNSFNFLAPADSEGTVKITAAFFSNDSLILKKKEWIVKYIFKKLTTREIFYYPVSDTSIFEGDTLKLGVGSFLSKDSLNSIMWSVNNFPDSLNITSSYLIAPDYFSSGIDTVSLSFEIGDSVFTRQWIINIRNKNRPPQIISVIPSIDSNLTKKDSILFKISCFDGDGDSLRFQWFRNNVIDTTTIDSFYYYNISDFEKATDSITVFISDDDTTIFAQWVLFPGSAQTIFKEALAFYPDTDSIFAENDSLTFSITNPPDSISIQWFINSRIESSKTDSSLIFYPVEKENNVDTIRVIIVDRDSTFSHQWYIYYPDLPIQNDSLKLTFLPEIETITFSTSDSLKFLVQLKEGNLSDINIHWFVNHELEESNTDTAFFFKPDTFTTSIDTITALITHADTTIFRSWAIRYEAALKLFSPILLFPIEGNRISEFESLTWENDSSLAAIDSTTEWKYIVHLSNDSTFSELVSADTCSELSIPLNELKGFENISIGKPVYWHVKLFSKGNKVSEFASSVLPFYYYPIFIILENFWGEKKQEGVFLYWTTTYEENCAGFNIFRSETPDGKFEKVNEYLVTGNTSYLWTDKTSQVGTTFYYKLEEITINGRKQFHQPISIELPTPVSYSLSHNFPNPFNSTTSFKYQIPKTTNVLIEVFNILGKKVKTLIDERKDAGYYTVYWDGVDDNGENVVSGIYFYIISADKFHATQKMIVVR